MPRYFFHVRDGHDMLDKEGRELPDLQAARAAAAEVTGGLLMDHPETYGAGTKWHVELADETGLTLCRIDVKIMEGAPV